MKHIQSSAVHKTDNRFLFNCLLKKKKEEPFLSKTTTRATSTLFEFFHPPPSSLNPLDLFSLPAVLLAPHIGALTAPLSSQLPSPLGMWKESSVTYTGASLQAPMMVSAPESLPRTACANQIPIPRYIFSLNLKITVSDL